MRDNALHSRQTVRQQTGTMPAHPAGECDRLFLRGEMDSILDHKKHTQWTGSISYNHLIFEHYMQYSSQKYMRPITHVCPFFRSLLRLAIRALITSGVKIWDAKGCVSQFKAVVDIESSPTWANHVQPLIWKVIQVESHQASEYAVAFAYFSFLVSTSDRLIAPNCQKV